VQAGGEIDAGRGLPEPPFWLVNGEDAGHARSIHDKMPLRPSPGTAKACTCFTRKAGQALDLLEGMDTLHRGEPRRPVQADDLSARRTRNFGERAGNEAIEIFSGLPSLDPLAYNGGVLQLKVRYAA